MIVERRSIEFLYDDDELADTSAPLEHLDLNAGHVNSAIVMRATPSTVCGR